VGGADCVYVPGPSEPEVVARLAREIAGPLNVVLGLNGGRGDARALIAAGARRITVGGSIARAALGLVQRAARELRDQGTISYGAGQIDQAELNAIFERREPAGAA
jgi:2-methylisocitrate lyase-like PEP mutase family enzyme